MASCSTPSRRNCGLPSVTWKGEANRLSTDHIHLAASAACACIWDKQRERVWEVVGDFPEEIPVLPGELKVIETYLAAILDESFEQMGLQTDKAAKCDVE
jgi:hypothetical protein